ncbi:MAG TPA: hypothetical protein VI387_04505 [Candidatus Brocadiales bacterium]|nr:hypothetical protein [Candidatus Brocadiales bacterium]
MSLPYSTLIDEKRKFCDTDFSIQRIRFLLSAFGVSKEIFNGFRFDGYNFWLPEKINCKEFIGVDCIEKEIVDLGGYSLPLESFHPKEYLHKCLDGTPDLRYKYNPLIQRSIELVRYKICFRRQAGICEPKLCIFDNSIQRVTDAIKRMNKMLKGMADVNIEKYFVQYEETFNKLEELNAIPSLWDTEKSLKGIIEAWDRLDEAGKKTDDELETKYLEAKKQHDMLRAKYSNISESRNLCIAELKKIIDTMQVDVDKATIRSYKP